MQIHAILLALHLRPIVVRLVERALAAGALARLALPVAAVVVREADPLGEGVAAGRGERNS